MIETVISYFIRYLVFALMLSIGLAARWDEIEEVWRRPKVYVKALLVMEIGVPLVAIAVVALLRPPPLAAALILLMAVCPGAPALAFMTREKGTKHAPVGLDVLLLVSLLAPLAVPAWVFVLDRLFAFDLVISPRAVLEVVLPAVLAPILIGMGLRVWFPRAADLLARLVDDFFAVGLVVAVIVLLYLGVPVLFAVRPVTVAAALLVVAGAALLGFWAGSPDPANRSTIGVAAVLGNPGLALAVVATSFPGVDAAALIAAYLILRALALVPIKKALKRGGRRRREPLAGPAQEPGGRTLGRRGG